MFFFDRQQCLWHESVNRVGVVNCVSAIKKCVGGGYSVGADY